MNKTNTTNTSTDMKFWDRRVEVARSAGLRRFLNAQEAPCEKDGLNGWSGMTVFDRAMVELENGRKRTHWMWFVFPQGPRWNTSFASQVFALDEIEAACYLAHGLLRARLELATEIVLDALAYPRSLVEIFGHVDALKFQSSMELFAAFGDRYYVPTIVEAAQIAGTKL